MICDFKKRGSRFIETTMYKECLHKLGSTRNLVISGNPGEGKTRYAVELICSKTEPGRRLFLTYVQQLENIDLEHIDGVIIDNIYGDVSFYEDKCKRWKEQMPYLIARCKNNKPFYVIATSRSYILMKSTDPEIRRMKCVELLTTRLAMGERVSILQSHCSIADPLPLISAFKSPIGLPQVCYMYSTSDQFCGGDIFHHPEEFIKNILQTFELEDRMLFFAIALVVFHRGTFALHDIRAEEFDKINNYTRLNFGEYDLQMALTRLCGSFIQYNEPVGNYQFLHDSLFETCCSYIGGRYSDLFISLSDVRVLVEFARIQQQAETTDRIYTYIPKSRCNIINLAARYVSEMKKDARFKYMLTKSDALFCEELLSECLINLQENDMLKQFLNVADPNESLLVEFCIMNQPELVKLVMEYMDTFSCEDWVKSQKGKAKTRCKLWEYHACLDIFEDDEEYLSDDNSYFSECSDEDFYEEFDETSFVYNRTETEIVCAIQRRDEKALKNLVDTNVLSDSDLCNLLQDGIAKGMVEKIYFETTPQVTNNLIHHSVQYRKSSPFKFFTERAITTRVSMQMNVPMSDTTKSPFVLDVTDIDKMIEIIDKEDAHLLALYILVNGCLNLLLPLLEIDVPHADIEYIHDMNKVSKRFGELSDKFSGILTRSSQNLKVKDILYFGFPDFMTDCICDSLRSGTSASFFIAVKSVILNRISIENNMTDDSVDFYLEKMSRLGDKEDVHLLVLYCVVNSYWDSLLPLLEVDVPRDDIEYIHDMKDVSERFKTLSCQFRDILPNSSQGLKVIHIVLLERPDLTIKCVHQSVRYDMPFAFSLTMKSAITNRLSVKASKTDVPLDDNNGRISKRVNKEDVHLLVLYCVVNSYWDSLLPLLEVEVPRDDIEYIYNKMKHFSMRFKKSPRKFGDILPKSSQGLKVIHIVLLERPDLTIKCVHQSVQDDMSFAFSIAIKMAIANRMLLQDSLCDAAFHDNVEWMSRRIDKDDVHLLVLYCIVNSCWTPLLSLLQVEVPHDDIKYIHNMKDVSERSKTLSDNFSEILEKSSQGLKVIHIVLLERPDLTIECIHQSLRFEMYFAFSVAMKRAIVNRLSVRDGKVDLYLENTTMRRFITDQLSLCVQRISNSVYKEDVHLLLLYCVVNNCWKPLLSLADIKVPRGDLEYIHDMKNVSEIYGTLSTICSSILAKRSQDSNVFMSDILNQLDRCHWLYI